MSDFFSPCVGGVLSADIAVPDHEQEVSFHTSVLTTGEHPLWRDDLMNNRGMPIIGLGERSEAYASLPLQWMPHIQVADVAASAQRAVDLGGEELMHGKDEDGNSQWAVLLDPNGAAFGIIPVVPAEAVTPQEDDTSKDPTGRMGHISGISLTVLDASAARDFYCQVVGWSVEEVPMEDGDGGYANFRMSGEDGRPVAGIHHARGEDKDLPATWLLHLPVGDLAESLRHVQEGGGKVLKTMRGADGECTFAAMQDPVGAYLALVSG
ncbi:MAG: VOC family protein [Planctomycetota bacterium]